MADTSGQKMDKKNVLYPEGGGHAKLGVWSSIKGQLPRQLAPLVEGDLHRMKTSDADSLIRDAMDKKEAVKDTYFKVGLVGTTLVVRVKTQQKGLAQILGYEQKDAVLLKDCVLKSKEAPSSSKVTEEVSFPSFVALAPGDCKPIVTEYLDIGKGYALTLSVKVEGADKDSGLRARVAQVHKDFCKDYQDKAKGIADDVAGQLSRLTVKSGKSLKKVAEEADAALSGLFDEATVAKAFEAAVLAMAKGDSNLKQHVREWKIKGACKAITTTVKLTTNILTLVASHGADVSAYGKIVKCGYDIYTLITDFAKTELAAATELDKAIELYKASSNALLDTVQDLYKTNRIASGTVIGAIRTAGDAAAVVQDKITRAIKSFTGKDVAQQPEEVRLRYLVELGKLLNALDAKVATMTEEMEKFRQSSINEAVRAWPALQALKKACTEAADYLRARKKYAEDAKKKIADLNIAVDDSTTLDKLKAMVSGLRELDKDKVIGGSVEVTAMAATAKSAFDAVKDLVKEVNAFV